ncbi:MAG: phosphoribosylglycinamide formyltransferase [Oscillospiraceae bacterium]|nr:phosphoribosylglycinamide formyltransferase [Oscillospiraceae bacterium]
MYSLVVFASGGGSTLQAIIDNIDSGTLNAKISLVVSDNPNAFAIKRAEKAGIPSYIIKSTSLEERDLELKNELEKHDINLIVLAGYLKMIGNRLIDSYTIINTHPSLLPAYGGKGMYGMRVHNAVVEAKEQYSGVTVHYVNSEYDDGAIISQAKVTLTETETPESLSKKVQEIEKTQLINVIKYFISKTTPPNSLMN